ncbi:tyrosinase family oxidase copper chaperone [Streptomyces aureoverticillatus]|uniref:tyrosinase family oxidase copper chaperone n=1 Tax=Streptomyces aureoverticillatus TaxID=66871 RepID=UPI0013D9E54F|nr:tyrosinase family oxidase copper chaperone [Streptomyces aureoverticillatus]QIB44705.1 tyrosinase co-factor [Streptomyces aureoverticillatus]
MEEIAAVPSARTVPRLTRRHLIAAAATAVLGAVGAFRGLRGSDEADEEGQPGAPGGPSLDFDETYRGRRIQGEPVIGDGAHGPEGWRVSVDGQPLGLMRRADGSYLSMVDHYQSYATPLAAARGAVDELGTHQTLSGRLH